MSELGYTILLFSLPNYARRIGLDAHQGAVVAALIDQIIDWQTLYGSLERRLGKNNYSDCDDWDLCNALLGHLDICQEPGDFVFLCFALLSGIVCGTFWATLAPVGADVAGLSELPSTLSVILFLMVSPTTCE